MVSLLDIVLTFAKIGLLSFGGGYAGIPIVENQIVNVKQWMSLAEFSDIVTIDELTPGPIAINAATFVGIKMAGIPGAIAATIGAILPSTIIALILVKLYYKYRSLKPINGALYGLKSMVVALIGSTTLTILINALFYYFPIDVHAIDYIAVILFSISLFILRKYKPNPILVMIGCGLIGLIIYPLI